MVKLGHSVKSSKDPTTLKSLLALMPPLFLQGSIKKHSLFELNSQFPAASFINQISLAMSFSNLVWANEKTRIMYSLCSMFLEIFNILDEQNRY